MYIEPTTTSCWYETYSERTRRMECLHKSENAYNFRIEYLDYNGNFGLDPLISFDEPKPDIYIYYIHSRWRHTQTVERTLWIDITTRTK